LVDVLLVDGYTNRASRCFNLLITLPERLQQTSHGRRVGQLDTLFAQADALTNYSEVEHA